eukprot:TRINITY_DN109910_c0_g1_i1.p1 TRINITY_DN109910_c0_g1~~TRINITY_DN109910_c0_g1_i1.p1  ORF type:complete len:312 (+),score=37.80 TRINITY_DN109910_c0_g1_i1:159-1094(+)
MLSKAGDDRTEDTTYEQVGHCDPPTGGDPQIPPWKVVPSPFDPSDMPGGYRLGDMISTMYRWDLQWGQQYHFKIFPQSLASMYMRATEEKHQWDVLSRCVDDKFGRRDMHSQHHKYLVVHLRTGDVMDDKHARSIPVQRYLSEWVVKWRGGYYVTPRAYYQNFEIPRDVKRVIITSNPHFQIDGAHEPHNSYEYIDAIKQVFLEKGVETVEVRVAPKHEHIVRSSVDADEDFALAVSAEALIISGGGFGRALGSVAKLRGASVWKPPQVETIQHLVGMRLEGKSGKACSLEEFHIGDSWEQLGCMVRRRHV